jgi:hypothetical protein
MQTGYFARTETRKEPKVHAVFSTAPCVPVCGTPVPDGAHFHFCAQGAHYAMLTCKKCQRWCLDNSANE